MRNHWWIYGLIGLCFGILDWYFLDLLASFGKNQALNEYINQAPVYIPILTIITLVTLNYGIWLVPVIPVAIREMKISHSMRLAAISAVIVWAAAMVSYYSYYAFLLMFVGLPNLDFMLFSNHSAPQYWDNWWPTFRGLILGQFLEWIVIAIICGSIVGTVSAYIFNRISKRCLQRASIP